MKWLKWIVFTTLLCMLLISAGLYFVISSSLPKLDGDVYVSQLTDHANLSRDSLGSAIINASNEYDMAFVLGYAHAQDRLFQMDLLRRQSAGELSELVGERALNVDRKHRFHQFRKRAEQVFKRLSEHEQKLLQKYTQGVNAGSESLSSKPYEYLLLGSEFTEWSPIDSLLVSYSMYIDLQLSQTEIDFTLNAVKSLFGSDMHAFFTLPSPYQAAIDDSIIPVTRVEIPLLPLAKQNENKVSYIDFNTLVELPDIGSNNWVVSDKLTSSTSAMLSNDMHLGLNVPVIWYKAQLRYSKNKQNIEVTGVSLPGLPAIVVGSNGHIAWGFTNANVDNVDWIELDEDTETHEIIEEIKTPKSIEKYSIEMSPYGPVRRFNGKRYALVWVAHQDYAVNMLVANMAQMKTVQEALALSSKVRIPVQNMVVADEKGQIAWQLTGAITARTHAKRHAINESAFSPMWEYNELSPANSVNPQSQRIYTANARVISTQDLNRFGDGGYALGARQLQIADLLKQKRAFTENDFYELQLNNQSVFLLPWHSLLHKTLSNDPQVFAQELDILDNWKACACPDSVAYTLVRRFRSTVINQLMSPVDDALNQHGLSARYLLRGIEPAMWEILMQKPRDWLPQEHQDYTMFLIAAYKLTKTQLLNRYSDDRNLMDLRWGKVNTMQVVHPFAEALGPFASLMNMPDVEGFGDSFMPAVQSQSFGASQRLIVQPGAQENAILTIPGGQSGHFLSPFYRSGFKDYATQVKTPLMPGPIKHNLRFIAIQ